VGRGARTWVVLSLPMTFEIISSIERLRSLEQDWDALWRRNESATPFQSPHWLLPWWNAFGCGELHVIAAYDDRGLQSLAPFCILRDEDSGESLGLLLGTGVSDYLDVIGDNEHGQAILDQLAAADCQTWDLQQLRPSSPLLSPLAPRGWIVEIEEQDSCPRLGLETGREGLEDLLSPHARKKLRYSQRALERVGNVAFEEAGNSTIDSMMDALFELHSARWRRSNLPGVLADEVAQDFHRDVARRMLRAGALRMFAVQVGTKTAGVFYGFADRSTVYYYLSGYDPDLQRFGIGNMMVAHAIEAALRSGATTFDFLRGAEGYKYGWGATDRVNQRRVMRKSTG
jgi:CelD/BcsL family acetyltransferase involved in cellulose biosynthesis